VSSKFSKGCAAIAGLMLWACVSDEGKTSTSNIQACGASCSAYYTTQQRQGETYTGVTFRQFPGDNVDHTIPAAVDPDDCSITVSGTYDVIAAGVRFTQQPKVVKAWVIAGPFRETDQATCDSVMTATSVSCDEVFVAFNPSVQSSNWDVSDLVAHVSCPY
jgi:hypothetical protein